MDHLLDGVEIGIVEVPEEPEDARPEDLTEQDDKGGKVEDVHHPDKPVDENAGPRGVVE